MRSICAVLILCFLLPNFALAKADFSCAEAIKKFISQTEPTRVQKAVENVLNRWLKRGEIFRTEYDESVDERWVAEVLPTLVARELSASEVGDRQDLSDVRSGSDAVQAVLLNSYELGIFRPATLDPEKNVFFSLAPMRVRKVWAGAHLAQLLGVEIVAKSQAIKIGSELGIWSEFIPNALKEPRDFRKDPRVSDALAFEFLVGQYDVVADNYRLQEKHGGLRLVDHDLAFWHLIPVPASSSKEDEIPIVGRVLPDQYSVEFISGLRALTPDRIQSEFSKHLSPGEIQSLIFRREVILEDYQLRFSTP